MAKEQSINQIRADLIKGFKEAETETEKAQYRAELLATMDDKEKATYLNTDMSVVASELVHLKHTLEALKEKFALAGDLAVVFGFPTSEKVKTVSGKNTVQINTTIEVVDTDRLKQDCQTYTEIAKGVELAIEKKRAKVSIDTLTATDLKNLVSDIPKKEEAQTKVYIR